MLLHAQSKEMKLKLRRLASAVAAASILATGAFAAPALATSTDSTSPDAPATVTEVVDGAPSASDEALLRAFFDEYGVEATVQDSLIAAMSGGDPWLSLTGADPVSERVEIHDGAEAVISTYADGSIAVSSTSIPKPEGSGGIGTRSILDCTTSSTAYSATYSNCLADVNLGVIRMYFRFTWQKVFGSSASITSYNANSYGGHCIGCSLSNKRVYRISSTDVRYEADSNLAWNGSPLQFTAYMGARVSLANGAWTYHN